jgi:phosphate transport system protein
MAIHMLKEIERLKRLLLTVAALAEENVRAAVKAVADRDERLAHQVIEKDRDIDRSEVAVEEECLKILALHQPVAHDLRYIVAILKINHDLERIGDLAVSIAERGRDLSRLPKPQLELDLLAMAENAQRMVARSLDALLQYDIALAKEIWLSDDDMDRRNDQIYRQVAEAVRRHPDHIEALLCLLSVSRNLERMADHATNIAKDVIYMIEGEIVRHRSREYRAAMAQGNGKPAPPAPAS